MELADVERRLDSALSGARTRAVELPEPSVRRLLRHRAGLTLQDIAATLGVTHVAVSRWEVGRREPRGKLREAYAYVLDRLAKA